MIQLNIKKHTRSAFRRYRILPLILTGLLLFGLICGIGLLIWTLICYWCNITPQLNITPKLIWLGAIFLSCGMITFLIRGGTVFPSAIVSLISAIISLFLADPANLHFWPALGKSLLTLLCGVAGFTLVKILVPRKKARPRTEPQRLVERA